MKHTIKLNARELWLAGMTGLMRWVESMARNRTPVNNQNRFDSLTDHLTGAMAEAAFAKLVDVYWLGEVNTFKTRPDVGQFEVRYSRRSNARLLLQPEDSDEAVFVLITGEPPNFEVHGCLRGADGKQDRFWDKALPRPCYAVPQRELERLPDGF